MTKEELIALSDLNREDNIKYISSEAQGIAIALDSDRYAPTLCKLERAYICGRRKSEEQIAELKQSNKMLEQGYVWHDYDAGEDCYEDNHEGKWVKRDEVYYLTKTKEIIKKIEKIFYSGENAIKRLSKISDILAEAEQFLNSEVEK